MDKKRDWASIYELIIDKGGAEYNLSGELIKTRKGTAIDYSVLSEAMKNHRLQFIDPLGQRLLATDGGINDCQSKLFALNALTKYVQMETAGVEAYDDEESALYSFGWPIDVLPDFSSINPHYVTQNIMVDKASITQIKSDEVYEAELAELFDDVTVAELEKMFSAGGKWKGWAERAKRNELTYARNGRAVFNPYKAGVWFVKQNIDGYDLARCHRILASNLPARSKGSEHLLTGTVS